MSGAIPQISIHVFVARTEKAPPLPYQPLLLPERFFICICLSRRLFRVTLEISRAECNIDVTGDIDRY
jgi:hypothetical protein